MSLKNDGRLMFDGDFKRPMRMHRDTLGIDLEYHWDIMSTPDE